MHAFASISIVMLDADDGNTYSGDTCTAIVNTANCRVEQQAEPNSPRPY